MEKVFVPKKTLTVQMTLETWKRFESLRNILGLSKTKTFERMIAEAEKNLEAMSHVSERTL